MMTINFDCDNVAISESERKIINSLKKYLSEKNFTTENYLDMSKDNNVLYIAIKEFQNDIAEYLIKNIEDINIETTNKRTLLFSAIENNNFKIADILINEKNADINYVNSNQDNVLIYLIKEKTINSKSLAYILKHKINLNFQDKYKKTCFIYFVDRKLPEYVNQIIKSFIFNNDFIINGLTSWKNNTKLSQDLINEEFEKIDFDIKDRSGESVLFYAIRKNDYPTFKLIADHCKNFNPNKMSNSGFYLIHVATRYAQEDTVKYLLEHNAQVNVYDKFGRTPFYYACQYHQEKLVKLFISTNQIKLENYVRNPDILSFVNYLCQCGNVSLFDYFISNGFNIYFRDSNRCTPLIIAVEFKQLDMIKYLLNHNVNINDRDNSGRSALMRVLGERSFKICSENSQDYSVYKEIIELLLNNGANVNDRNSNNVTPLMLACGCNKKEIAEILINRGANIHDICSTKSTPLIYASHNNNVELIDLLISKGAYINHQDDRGCSSLIYAIQSRNIDVVKYLVQKGADVNVRDWNNKTPLIHACGYKFIEAMKILLDNGADINAQDDHGESSLINSIGYNYEEVVKVLLEYNIDINLVDNNNKTALDYATERNYDTIKELIEEHAQKAK